NRVGAVSMCERTSLKRADEKKNQISHRERKTDPACEKPEHDQNRGGKGDQFQEAFVRETGRLARFRIAGHTLHAVWEQKEPENDSRHTQQVGRPRQCSIPHGGLSICQDSRTLSCTLPPPTPMESFPSDRCQAAAVSKVVYCGRPTAWYTPSGHRS